MLLSLFCGAGGLDLGFENAGFNVGLAFDRNPDSVRSYNENRTKPSHGHVGNVKGLTLARLDKIYGKRFAPKGVIGGPPCQSFSQANVNQQDGDPRDTMPLVFANLVKRLNERDAVDFFALENVRGLTLARHRETLERVIKRFEQAGFEVTSELLNAENYNTPQSRPRFFLVGFNRERFGKLRWVPPEAHFGPPLTVRHAISGLPSATHFKRGLSPEQIAHHPNHWCMQPKSPKFSKAGALVAGDVKSRSFKTLAWDKPSIAVAYGHREVHIHPSGTRRLTVYEAMLLQGFPPEYRLHGSLSSQIDQVSEAVPPPLAYAVAQSVWQQINKTEAKIDREKLAHKVVDVHRPESQIREPFLPGRQVVVG